MKKKSGKIFFGSIIAMLMVLVFSITGFAMSVANNFDINPTVTVSNSSSNSFEFSFNRKNADLFDNFKGVMPGDVIDQTISVKSAVSGLSGGSDVNIYLYARNISTSVIGDNEKQAPSDLMDRIKITVKKGNQVLDLVNAGEGTSGVHLGKFSTNEKLDLTVTMEVPVDLTNEYQNCMGNIEWYFYAQQVTDGGSSTTTTPKETDTTPSTTTPAHETTSVEDIDDDEVPLSPPEFETIEDDPVPLVNLPVTGVQSNTMFYGIMIIISLVTIIVLNKLKNKRNN